MKEVMLKRLVALRDNGGPAPFFQDMGICGQVTSTGITEKRWLEKVMDKWPEHSGNREYPVPHPTGSPEVAYHLVCNKWDRNTAYGQARWRLLEWLIEELRK